MLRTHFVAAARLLLFALLFGTPTGSAAATTEKALFIYWRGETPCEKGLKDGLKAAGLNLEITEFDAAQNKQRLEHFIETQDERSFKFVYTFGTTATQVVAQRFHKTPILFGIVASPVKAKIIDSWDSPGKNVTGISHTFPAKGQVDFILRLATVRRVGMIYNPAEENARIAYEEVSAAVHERGVELVTAPLKPGGSPEAAVEALLAQKIDFVYLPSDSLVISQSKQILPALTKKRVPTYGAVEELVKNGAIIGIVANYYTVGKGLAKMAQAVLSGTAPADIPASRLPLAMQTVLINRKTLRELGLKLPEEIVASGTFVGQN